MRPMDRVAQAKRQMLQITVAVQHLLHGYMGSYPLHLKVEVLQLLLNLRASQVPVQALPTSRRLLLPESGEIIEVSFLLIINLNDLETAVVMVGGY